MTRLSSVIALAGAALLLPAAAALFPTAAHAGPAETGHVVVDIGPRAVEHDFVPQDALGFGLDGLEQGDVDKVYTPGNIEAMKSAGFHRLTYRLRTELGIEAWHWNSVGQWSDPAHSQGYWTSSDTPGPPILVSNGYSLPRRGDTTDQAEDSGYSRLDDGNTDTFWKSNPYLDPSFTHDPHQLPQWVFVDLGRNEPVDAAQILWGDPYAQEITAQYWVGSTDDPDAPVDGAWHDFSGGPVRQSGGLNTIRLAPKGVNTRYVRFLLSKSSGTAPPGAIDPRDRLGFAIREIYVGTIDASGAFHDLVRHAPVGDGQSVTYVSSTDPWHRSTDIDPNTEQPGIDRVYQSGLGGGRPAMMPVGVLYDTPENAAAMVRYIRARGYPLTQLELGEEPDGQQVSPEHFGALYLEFADALRSVDPSLSLGGPSLEEGHSEVWPEADGDTNYLRRLVRYLSGRNRLNDLSFVTFERYPFDNLCGSAASQLLDQPAMFDDTLAFLREAGLPPSVRLIITEYGFSAFAGRTMVEMSSALLNADMVGQFLSAGGAAAYYYGAEPNTPITEGQKCAGYGNMMLYEADESGAAKWPMPALFGARMLTGDWAAPADARLRLFTAKTDIVDPQKRALVSAYPLLSPDGHWSILLINMDSRAGHTIDVSFGQGPGKPAVSLAGPLHIVQYSADDYRWQAAGEDGHPIKDLPPRSFDQPALPLTLPPLSLTVVRGAGPQPALGTP